MEITRPSINLGTFCKQFASLFVALIVGLLTIPSASAQTARNWTGTLAGTYDWSDTANWTGGLIPDTMSESAVFGVSGAALQGSVIVNQDIEDLVVGGFGTANFAQSGTLTISGREITLNNNNAATQVAISAGSAAPIPIYNVNLNVTDPNGLVITAQNHMIINGNITTLSSGTTHTTGGGTVFLGGSNTLEGRIAVYGNNIHMIATNTNAFGGSGTFDFNPVTNAQTGLATRATGTTNVGYVINSGTFSDQTTARNSFSSGGAGTTLNITTSTFLNDTVGNAAFFITRATTNLPFSPNPTTIGNVMFSGSDFTVSRNVILPGSQTTGIADTRLVFAPASGTQTWSGNITRNNPSDVNTANWYALNADGPIVVKSGNGTVIFSGSNNYNFQTGVTEGTLLVNGVHTPNANAGALNAGRNGFGDVNTGNYLISSGATLGGTGRIAITATAANTNMILVQNGGFLAPGSSIGTFTLDGINISGAGSRVLNMASGAEFVFELDGSGGMPDQLAFWNYVSGDVLLSNNAINLSLVGAEVGGTYTVNLFTFYSDSGSTATASMIASGLTVGNKGANIGATEIIYNANVISLQYTVVPEPASAMLVLAAAGIFGMMARRRWVR